MATLRMVGIGFAFGSVLGIVVGLVMGTLPVAGAMLRPSVTAAYTIPKLGVFPLLLLIFGIGDTPKLVLVGATVFRSEEHTSELQSLMRISYAVFCLKKKKT